MLRRGQVVDTVLGRLYTESGETTDLLALIDGPNDIVLSELDPVLIESNRYDALCRLYKTRAQDAKLLDAWSRSAGSDLKDSLCLMQTRLTDWSPANGSTKTCTTR